MSEENTESRDDEALDDVPERYTGEFPISIRGLTNRFGDFAVHEDLDLDVKRGEILGVVGGPARASRS